MGKLGCFKIDQPWLVSRISEPWTAGLYWSWSEQRTATMWGWFVPTRQYCNRLNLKVGGSDPNFRSQIMIYHPQTFRILRLPVIISNLTWRKSFCSSELVLDQFCKDPKWKAQKTTPSTPWAFKGSQQHQFFLAGLRAGALSWLQIVRGTQSGEKHINEARGNKNG